MPSRLSRYNELHAHLVHLLNTDPALAVTQARQINLDTPERPNWMNLRASILVDGGALTQQQDAIEEGLTLFQELHSLHPTTDVTYNLANALVAAAGHPQGNASCWIIKSVVESTVRRPAGVSGGLAKTLMPSHR